MAQDNNRHWTALDGLRGVAAMIVLLSHANGIGIMMLGLPDFSGAGKAGVVLFFLLSSFLLASQFATKEFDSFSRSNLLHYFFRRFMRIYPLYVFYLLFALLMTMMSTGLGAREVLKLPFELDLAGFLRQITLLQGEGVTWSIVVEFKFYFLLPFIMLAMLWFRRIHLLLMAALVLAAIVLCQWIWPDSESLRNDIRVVAYAPVFLLGCLLASLISRAQKPLSLGRPMQRLLDLAGLLAVAALFCLLPRIYCNLSGRDFDPHIFEKSFVGTALLFGVVLAAAVAGNGITNRFFSLAPLRHLGRISFSLYLWHIVLIRVFSAYLHKFPIWFHDWFLNSPLNGWFLLAACLAVSQLSYLAIEKQFLKIKPEHWNFKRLATAARP